VGEIRCYDRGNSPLLSCSSPLSLRHGVEEPNIRLCRKSCVPLVRLACPELGMRVVIVRRTTSSVISSGGTNGAVWCDPVEGRVNDPTAPTRVARSTDLFERLNGRLVSLRLLNRERGGSSRLQFPGLFARRWPRPGSR